MQIAAEMKGPKRTKSVQTVDSSVLELPEVYITTLSRS